MKYSRWLDHLPPWASWAALAVSEVFSAQELFFMALPLLFAVSVEAVQWQLYRWRRLLELGCLFGLIACRFAKVGWVMAIILLLFMLCGARLSLPREFTQRRQITFMAFLLFLLTTIANTSISFLPMALLCAVITGLVLLQINWENSAQVSKTQPNPPPLRSVLVWISIAAILGCLVFIILPRPILRWRPLPFGIHGLSSAAAGLSDKIELDDTGIIQGNSDVVARILPPPSTTVFERKSMEARMALLTAFRLETTKDGKWERANRSPSRRDIEFGNPWSAEENSLEFFVYPSPTGVIPMPQGRLQIIPPQNIRIETTSNGMTRWAYPLARPTPFRFKLREIETEKISERYLQRLEQNPPDPFTIEALHWSLRVAPGEHRPDDLVWRLNRELQTFRYTLDNPSGSAKDPLGDFLTNTKAGHCEYFAHALASALRHRGVASRVVNGYRLGSWIEEGGYWLITQNQAHSWVEYVNPDTGAWITVDPTPPGAAAYYGRWRLTEKLSNIVDTMRFRWDRYVVRFSDTEQVQGLTWVQERLTKFKNMMPDEKTIYAILATIATLSALLAVWIMRNSLALFFNPTIPPGTVLALRPLIKASRIQPTTGETLRIWFQRLSAHRPDRKADLMELLNLIESKVYGNSDEDIVRPVSLEAKEWGKHGYIN